MLRITPYHRLENSKTGSTLLSCIYIIIYLQTGMLYLTNQSLKTAENLVVIVIQLICFSKYSQKYTN